MAGHLTLGYFNDFYSSDYRSASLERLRFTSAGCETFSTGPQSYTFMSNGWMTATSAKRVRSALWAEGQVAVGAAPQLQVALNSRVIWTGEFTEKREVNIPIPVA
ncbi:hypothetical protein CTI14_43645, partial [Methylobacterium radiotolerans]